MTAGWWLEPEVRGCVLDGPERLRAHRAVLERKQMIRDVFRDFHGVFAALDAQLLSGEGMTVELGAGVYPVRETRPGTLATDVVPAPHLDRILDAGAMDLPDRSVRAFYLQNVFHHFPDPRRFFSELERTLVPGGGAILIEPHSGAFASWIYPRLFASESYDKNAPVWEHAAAGPMVGANQALAHVILERDRKIFESAFSALEIIHHDVLDNYLRYLLSGGLNFRALAPAWTTRPLRGLEFLLRPVRRLLGLHAVWVLRKRNGIVVPGGG